jgi:hypothetical protein
MDELVWHYTYTGRIEAIIESKVLLPPALCAPRYVMSPEEELAVLRCDKGFSADKKLLLFSENQDWEPASYRGIQDRQTGAIRDVFDRNEYERYGIRIFRIGVDRNILKPYTKLVRQVRMPAETVRSLAEIARKIGSNPFQWWGTTFPVSIEQWKAVEYLDGQEWKSIVDVFEIIEAKEHVALSV